MGEYQGIRLMLYTICKLWNSRKLWVVRCGLVLLYLCLFFSCCVI